MYESWELLKNECLNCTKCPLCETRTNVVFGEGNPNSEVMFIGEGPGENEDFSPAVAQAQREKIRVVRGGRLLRETVLW